MRRIWKKDSAVEGLIKDISCSYLQLVQKDTYFLNIYLWIVVHNFKRRKNKPKSACCSWSKYRIRQKTQMATSHPKLASFLLAIRMQNLNCP